MMSVQKFLKGKTIVGKICFVNDLQTEGEKLGSSKLVCSGRNTSCQISVIFLHRVTGLLEQRCI